MRKITIKDNDPYDISNNPRIKIHPEAFKEFCDIVEHSGNAAGIYRQLEKKTRALLDCSPSELTRLSPFELLQGTNGLWSMHINCKPHNIRLLFKQRGQYLFLCVFHERDDSRRSSYDRYTEIANKRLQEL